MKGSGRGVRCWWGFIVWRRSWQRAIGVMVTAKLTAVIGLLNGQAPERGRGRAQNAKVPGIRTAAVVAANRLTQAEGATNALPLKKKRGMCEKRQIRRQDLLCILRTVICIGDR